MLELSQISKSYTTGSNTFHALSDVSLSVAEGEYLSIMGRSGSGKSTLLNIIGGVERPSSGEYYYLGNKLSRYSNREMTHFRRQIGFVFQAFHLIPQLTVYQNIELPLGYSGVNTKQRKNIVRSLLEKIELSDKETAYPKQLSGGQMQRIAIARAIAVAPRLLLADEPTGNLDTESSSIIMNLLSDLHHEGTTIILVTHDHEISRHASRNLFMSDGMIA
jgi:putative ABC transport system ATP-binding protein